MKMTRRDFAAGAFAAAGVTFAGCVNLIFRDFRIGRLNLATRTVESLRAYRLDGDPRTKGAQAG